MKQVNFSHTGGFPLEQETLERLQTAYRSELYEAIKAHLSIETDKNYIIAHATNKTKGWVIINKDEDGNPIPGVLYPISIGAKEDYLKATRVGTNLVYGNGISQTAYYDFNSVYIKQTDYDNRPATPPSTEALTEYYFYLKNFVTVKSIKTIEEIIEDKEGRIKTIETTLPIIDTRINTIKTDLESYLPLNGSKSMQGDLNLGTHQLYLNNLNAATSNDYLLAVNNQNQVVKNGTLLQSLIGRIETLEQQTSTAVPIGMIAIWGKPAPFPEGWEEYVPLRGRMPVGLDANDSAFSTLLGFGGNKEKTLLVNELPPHTHDIAYNKKNAAGGGAERPLDNTGTSTDTQKTGSTGGGQAFSILNPYRIVHFIEYTGNPSDKTAPTTPANLTASNIANTSLTLSWNKSTDNVGVTGYLVYKDNFDTLLADLGKDTLSYNVTGLSLNTNYNFYVKAKDAAGNLSDPAILNTTTTNSAPVIPTVPTLQHAYYGGPNMTLQWPNYIDSGDITYELYRSINGGGYVLLKKSTDTFYYDALSNGITYSYKIRINSNGYISPYSNTVTVTGNFS